MSEGEALLAILKERRQLYGKDAAPDWMMRRAEERLKPHGRDLYLARLQRAMDGSSYDSSADSLDYSQHTSRDSSLRGRDLWVTRMMDDQPHMVPPGSPTGKTHLPEEENDEEDDEEAKEESTRGADRQLSGRDLWLKRMREAQL